MINKLNKKQNYSGGMSLAIMLPLVFGFLLFGSGGNSGGFVDIMSSNKVIAPSFLNFGFTGSLAFQGFNFQPTFQPISEPVNFNSAFRWNFFDP